MHISLVDSRGSLTRLPVLLLGICCALLILPPLPGRAKVQPLGLRVINNAPLEISHLYLSSPDKDDWGPDQLGSSPIRTGETFVIDNVTCAQAEIKIIAEDQNGCFAAQVVSCSEGASWTIPANVTPDCGNN